MRGPGFQKRVDSGKRKKVRIAIIKQDERGFTHCSCGQPFKQPRDKVRRAAIDKHLAAKHGGRAIWL